MSRGEVDEEGKDWDATSAIRFRASDVFSDALATQVNQQDIESMIAAQKHMMSKFEKTNEMLINCNALSAVRFHTANHEFKRHTNLLLDMKKDLDAIFKRIRNIKTKFSVQYPQAFRVCNDNTFEVLAEEEDLRDGGSAETGVEKVSAQPPPSIEVVPSDSVRSKRNTSNYSSSCSQSTSSASPVNSISTSDSG